MQELQMEVAMLDPDFEAFQREDRDQ